MDDQFTPTDNDEQPEKLNLHTLNKRVQDLEYIVMTQEKGLQEAHELIGKFQQQISTIYSWMGR